MSDVTDPVATFRAMRAKQEEAAKSGVKRPWRVTLRMEQQLDICVIASSQREAEKIALANANEEAENVSLDDDWRANSAAPLLQDDNFGDSIPYGGDGEKTVDEWLAELEAPK